MDIQDIQLLYEVYGVPREVELVIPLYEILLHISDLLHGLRADLPNTKFYLQSSEVLRNGVSSDVL